MKSFYVFLMTLSLATGQLRQSVSQAKFRGQHDELLLTHDDKSHDKLEHGFGVAEDDPTALALFQPSVDISARDFTDEEREMFVNRMCKHIESLLSGQVVCKCDLSPLFDQVDYSCNRFKDVETASYIYTPNFFGSFLLRLFDGETDLWGGVCAGAFSVYVAELGVFLKFGDFCVRGDFSVVATKIAPYLDLKATSCTLSLGNLAECDCFPCTVNGLPGVEAECSVGVGGASGLPIPIPCLPIAIPLTRASGKTDVTTIIDDLNLGALIEIKVEEYKAQLAAEQQNDEEDIDENEDRDEKDKNNREGCRNGFCDRTRDQNEDDEDESTGDSSNTDEITVDDVNATIAPNDTTTGADDDQDDHHPPKPKVEWSFWDSVKNFLW